MVSQAASRRNLTVVLSDRDLPDAMSRLHEEFFSSVEPPGERPAARVLLVGYGRMGRLVEQLAGEPAWSRWPVTSAVPLDAPPADVAVDFSTAAAVPSERHALAARGISVVIGTTGWHEHEAEMRAAVRDFPVGVLAAPNFAIGVNAFFAIAEQAAELLPSRVRTVHPRSAPRRQEGRAVGHRHFAAVGGDTRGRTGGGYGLHPGRLHPGDAHPRVRRGSETITLTHTARDRTAFARGARSGEVDPRTAGVVQHARHARNRSSLRSRLLLTRLCCQQER